MRAFLSARWSILALWCLFASLIDFALMGLDKRKARREDRRIPERVLWAFALLGGGVGGFLGMRCFRHKTRHWYFRYGFPLLAVLDLAGLVWLLPLWNGL